MAAQFARHRLLLSAIVVGLLLGSSLGIPSALAAPPSSTPSAGPSHPASAAASSRPAGPSLPVGRGQVPTERSPVVAAVQREIAEHLLNGRNAFLPSPIVHTAQPAPGAAVSVVPLSSPGPMGLADLGIGPGGAPYEYNTSAFEGTVQLSSFAAYSPGYAEFADAPDWTTLQLNAVGVNLSYPGSIAGTFWLQNVVHFNGTALQFEDNVWNFSSPTAAMLPGTFYSFSPDGHLGEYNFYYAYGPTVSISYPFSLTLGLTLGVVDGRPVGNFTYSVTTTSGTVTGTYDSVVFNGPATNRPQFRVDGGAYDPFGDEYDTEFTIGGDGAGRNANLVALDGNATLDRWDAKTARFVSVPSAYDHGVDSGETAAGVAASYVSNRTAVERLTQGPSFLYGLWNTSGSAAGPSARPGYIRVALSLAPDYAFAFASNLSLVRLGLANAEFAYAPSGPSGVVRAALPPPYAASPYVFEAWANGFENRSLEIAGNSSHPYLYLNLTASATTLSSPVYLSSDGEVAAYGAAKPTGTGYAPSASTLWLNASGADLAAPFLRVNGFDYPTFVLSAFADVNDSIRINAFVQSATADDYSSPYDFLPLPPAGWTQGYYFFGGSGRFSVGNLSVIGNTTLYYEGVAPPAAVEFYGTSGASADRITAGQESFGVAAIGSVDSEFASIVAETGANAVTLINTTGASATGVSADGTDYSGASSTGAFVYFADGTNLTTVSATNGGEAVLAQSSDGLTIRSLTVSTTGLHSTSEGLLLNATRDVALIGLVASASVGVLANGTTNGRFDDLATSATAAPEIWGNSSHLEFDGLNFSNVSTGAWFLNDTDVTVDGANAVNGSAAIDRFANSTNSQLAGVSAADGSLGVNATGSTGVTIRSVSATNESLAVILDDDAATVVDQLTATVNSTALVANDTPALSVTGVTVTGVSLGVDLSNSTGATIRWVNATAAALPPPTADYGFNPITGERQPVGAVALTDDLASVVSNVSAQHYPFAVEANETNRTLLDGVSALDGDLAVALNDTRSDTIAAVFAYADGVGLNLTAANYTNLTASTLEECSSYGLIVDNGTHVRVYDNNFIANNGAASNGVYAGAHIQAKVYNGTLIQFNLTAGLGNFWSDYTPGTGGYIVRSSPGIVDHDPHGAVVRHWLEFYAGGLPSGIAWGITVLGSTYGADVPVLYLPGDVLPDRPMPYTVVPPAGYIPEPSHGTAGAPASNASKNVTVIISFTTLYSVTFPESGLPAGKSWSVTFNGTTETALGRRGAIEFNATSGSYAYAIGRVNGWSQSTLPRTGTVTVGSAAVRETTLAFVQVVYAVAFSETGLPAKTSWSVTLNGTPASETTTSITFTEPNGSYPYTVAGVAGYTSDRSSGTATVNGGTVSIALRFNVTASPKGPSSTVPWTYVGIGAGVLVVAAVAALLLRRGKRRAPPEAPAGPNDPPGF